MKSGRMKLLLNKHVMLSYTDERSKESHVEPAVFISQSRSNTYTDGGIEKYGYIHTHREMEREHTHTHTQNIT